jgi:dipeptidyl aminopeptidase/acylaminoacyl peptidase
MKMTRDLIGLLAFTLLTSPLYAQDKRPLDHSDYDLWNRVQNDVVSRDGRWLAYRLVPGDGDARVIIRALRGDASMTVERGKRPTFSADSRFVVMGIAPMEEAVKAAREAKKGKKGKDGPKDSLAIVDLGDLSVVRIADVKSFELPEDAGGWVAYRLEKSDEMAGDSAETPEAEAEGEEAAEENEAAEAPRTDDGTTLVLRALGSGEESRMSFVADYAFADDGSVLYYAASGEDGAADGVFRVEDGSAEEPVTTGEGRYLKLAVSGDGAVAFVTDRDDRDAEAPAFALYVSANRAEPTVVAAGAAGLPDGWAPSRNGDVSFSDSGRRVFFGTATAPEPEEDDDTPDDEKVSVDIWNWRDPYLQPMQLLQADSERKRSYEAVLDIASGAVTQLATTDLPNVTVAEKGDGAVALGVSGLPYRQLISWDGRYADLYLVDVSDGSRTMVGEKVRGRAQLSPDGRYVTWWDGFAKSWFAYDVASGQTHDLTGALDVGFYDVLDDHPDALRSYGNAGWTENDGAFVVYDRYDIWMIDPTGASAPRNVTEGVGRRTDTRFRYLDLDRDDPFIPADGDVYLTAFQLHTKASGIYRDRFEGSREPSRLVMDDAQISGVRRAEDADVFVYRRSTFRDSPDIWTTDEDFRDGRRVTDANPQQADYSWGTAELVEWNSNDGIPLQGILYKPDDFDAAKRYPMMVYFYERMSDGLHRYIVPAAGSSSINLSFYVSRGYLVFVPDIPYRIGYPGESALDAVVPGVLELVDRGFVDRDHIGVQGHSWGGYQISYMVTRTDLFAAAEAGAPVSNMISAYGGIRWGSGMSRMFQYEHTQSRIGGSLWEKPLRYIENSAIFTADKIRTPLLMMHNDKDTAVPWYQGIELFVALRRLGQPVWMFNYNGEPHGLRKKQNRKDWAVRMQQFFDYYLKGAPAPVWLEEGVPAVLKGKTLGLDLVTKKTISEEGGTGR